LMRRILDVGGLVRMAHHIKLKVLYLVNRVPFKI
jgi:hypothetical protein